MPSAADTDRTFTLQIERSMVGLEQLGGWVDTVAGALGLDEVADYALRLCLEEAAANVVMHGTGCGDAGGDSVALRIEQAPDALRLIIEDHCSAFDPLQVPAPKPPANLGEARVGGLGIHLMREYARAIDYARVDGMNRLMLTIGR